MIYAGGGSRRTTCRGASAAASRSSVSLTDIRARRPISGFARAVCGMPAGASMKQLRQKHGGRSDAK